MGSSFARELTPEQMKQQKIQERKRALQTRGVLIPPSFGVGTSAVLTPSSVASYDDKMPSRIQHVSARLPCNRLLQEHLVPGLWISATTAPPGLGSVLASWMPFADNYKSMLCASQKLGTTGQVELRARNVGTPNVTGYYCPMPGCQLNGTIHSSGGGWFGCHFDMNLGTRGKKKATENAPQEYYRNDPFVQEDPSQNSTNGKEHQVKLASWVHFQKTDKLDFDTIQSVCGFAAVQSQGYTGAVEATVPISSWREPQLSYLASFDLNAEDGPPLTVTLEQSPKASSMTLSQIISFDRPVTYVLEERAPKIRNTIGWSVQMTKPTKEPNSLLSAACAWQVNRGLALKFVAFPQGNWSAGILLKRWKEPRVTCALLFGKDSYVGFKGIGVEIETGPPSWQSAKDLYYSAEGKAQASSDIPETKATLDTDTI